MSGSMPFVTDTAAGGVAAVPHLLSEGRDRDFWPRILETAIVEQVGYLQHTSNFVSAITQLNLVNK